MKVGFFVVLSAFSGFGIRLPVGGFLVASESDCIVNEKIQSLYLYFNSLHKCKYHKAVRKFKVIFVAHLKMKGK